MTFVTNVIIGAGQCGLAMSRALSARGIDHLLLERGQVGESWRSRRWDSLRLLTPNHMNGLPGAPYEGQDPAGHMTVPEFLGLFGRSADRCEAPILTGTTVASVTRHEGGYTIRTDAGRFVTRSVVVATGACAIPRVPSFAEQLPDDTAQFSPLSYKRPSQLPDGGVLVVGASASGLQLARELRLSGRRVVLAVGNHLRMPRRYRGSDIFVWMDRIGALDERWREIDNLDRVRRTPSPPLLGDPSRVDLDLNALQAMGVEIAGRLVALDNGRAWFSGSLANCCAAADLKLCRLLDRIDGWMSAQGLPETGQVFRPEPTAVPDAPRLSLDLSRERIGTIIWATGFRPDHSFLDMPVFDRKGAIRHDGGVVEAGLYVMGLNFLRTRRSAHIDGAARDADALAARLAADLSTRNAA